MSRLSIGRSSTPPTTGRREPRYGSRRWTELARKVRRRDGRCFVPGCEAGAQVADHIVPVYEGMPDSEFYDPRNLRGACRTHNLDRGRIAAATARLGGVDLSTEAREQDRPLAVSFSRANPSRVITGDFTRRAG